MLLRLNAVEEIGRFGSLTHKAEQFSRLSLVFARNAYGKSTLCSVLRSASENQPKYIQARRRLGAKGESRVQSSWAPNITIAFGGGSWNANPNKVYVFDQEFVLQNLHVGESVTRENKRSLLPVVLGEAGVQFAQKIIDLDREQRDLDGAMKADGAVIRAKCPSVTQDNLSAFCARAVPTDIGKRVESAAKAVELAKHAVAVKQKKNPRPIALESRERYSEIAARTIGSVTTDAAQRVRSHIEKHGLTPNGDKWLKYGVDRLQGDSCPLCDQNIAGLDLIDTFEAYFSDAFAALIRDRDAAVAALEEAVGDNGVTAVGDENAEDFSFWQTVCELPHPPGLLPEQRQLILKGLNALLKVFEQKTANPLASVSFGSATASIEEALTLIGAYNDQVAACVVAIETAKKAVQTADLKQAQNIHQGWIALAAKESDPIKSAAAGYAAAEARRTAIELEKKTAQDQLTAYAKKTMGTRQIEINNLLANFGTNFTIVDAKANFVGRDPNTEFAIAIGARKVKVGEKSDIEPSFKTVLSAGDKTTLALAFFIAQVQADPNLSSAVVVLDDPFNSQDMSRQFETTSQIRAISNIAAQTIVFSHDPRFLHMIEKDADHAITRTFQILCADNDEGTISPWLSADELKPEYVRQSEIIREFAGHGSLLKNVTHVSVLQAMRPFLEDYIRARFPGRFAELVMLADMIKAIQEAGVSDPLFGSIADLTALNEYTRPNMHGGGQTPDPTALRAQCQKIVRLIGKY